MTHVLLQGDELFIPDLTDDGFLEFCAQNRVHRIERTADGKVIVMPGTGFKTGLRSAEISAQLTFWARRDGRGGAVDAATTFRLPSSAMRIADAAWISGSKIESFSPAERERFLTTSPDFVIELKSPSDRLPQSIAKMEEWINNGCLLGWLIDPETRNVMIFRRECTDTLESPAQLTGEGPVAGFVLDLKYVWDPGW